MAPVVLVGCGDDDGGQSGSAGTEDTGAGGDDTGQIPAAIQIQYRQADLAQGNRIVHSGVGLLPAHADPDIGGHRGIGLVGQIIGGHGGPHTMGDDNNILYTQLFEVIDAGIPFPLGTCEPTAADCPVDACPNKQGASWPGYASALRRKTMMELSVGAAGSIQKVRPVGEAQAHESGIVAPVARCQGEPGKIEGCCSSVCPSCMRNVCCIGKS